MDFIEEEFCKEEEEKKRKVVLYSERPCRGKDNEFVRIKFLFIHFLVYQFERSDPWYETRYA